MAKEYRSRNRIVLDLLRAIQRERDVGRTRLLVAANLSTERLQGYLADLLARGFVVEAEENDRRSVRLTEAGQRFLAELNRIDRFMGDFGMSL